MTPHTFDKNALKQRFNARAARFAERQKAYGIGVQAGLVGALLLVALALRIPFSPESGFEVVLIEQELVAMEKIQQTRQDVTPRPDLPSRNASFRRKIEQ